MWRRQAPSCLPACPADRSLGTLGVAWEAPKPTGSSGSSRGGLGTWRQQPGDLGAGTGLGTWPRDLAASAWLGAADQAGSLLGRPRPRQVPRPPRVGPDDPVGLGASQATSRVPRERSAEPAGPPEGAWRRHINFYIFFKKTDTKPT